LVDAGIPTGITPTKVGANPGGRAVGKRVVSSLYLVDSTACKNAQCAN